MHCAKCTYKELNIILWLVPTGIRRFGVLHRPGNILPLEASSPMLQGDFKEYRADKQ